MYLYFAFYFYLFLFFIYFLFFLTSLSFYAVLCVRRHNKINKNNATHVRVVFYYISHTLMNIIRNILCQVFMLVQSLRRLSCLCVHLSVYPGSL